MTSELPTLAAVLRKHAESRGDRLALGFRTDGAWRTWTFTQYLDEIEQAARGLRVLGVAAGDHVLVLVVEPEAAATVVLGSWRIGAVPIQVGVPYRLADTRGFVSELEATAQRLRAKLLVVSDQFAQEAPNERVRVVTSTEMRAAAHDRTTLPAWDQAFDVALVQLTSGSTAHPRGVVIGHEELMLHLESMSRALPLGRDGMTGVSWLPLHHDMGLIGGLLFPLYNAFPVYLLSPLDFRTRPFTWLETISAFKAGSTAGPPSAYSLVIRLAERAREAKIDLGSLECAMVGAEPISPGFIRSFSAAFSPCGFRPEAFFPVYGLAEATVAVSFPSLLAPTRIDAVSRSALEQHGRALPSENEQDRVEFVCVGSAIPNSEIRIVGSDGHGLGEREIGEIHVRSQTLFRGYYGDPEATRDAVTDGWLRTGDLGYLSEGQLFVTARKKEIIIKGGHSLSPVVIEEIVSSVVGIRTGCVAAVGVPVQELETEEVWVVAETKLDPSEHRGLSHRVRDALKARGIAVDQVELIEPGTLPKTTSGKLQRTKVRDEMRSRAGLRRP